MNKTISKKDVIPELHRKYKEYNQLCFGGVLPEIDIRLMYLRNDKIGYVVLLNSGRYQVSIEVIYAAQFIDNHYEVRKTGTAILLHEMCHISLMEKDKKIINKIGQFNYNQKIDKKETIHGKVFHAECNRVAAIVGLPEVKYSKWKYFFKRKYQDEDIQSWPHRISDRKTRAEYNQLSGFHAERNAAECLNNRHSEKKIGWFEEAARHSRKYCRCFDFIRDTFPFFLLFKLPFIGKFLKGVGVELTVLYLALSATNEEREI